MLRVTYFSRVLRIGYFCCTEKGQFDLSRDCGHGPSPITHSSGFFFLPLKCSFIYSQGCFHIERRASREIYIHITMTCQTQRSRGRMNVMARERWLYNGYFSGSSWFDVKVSLALYFPWPRFSPRKFWLSNLFDFLAQHVSTLWSGSRAGFDWCKGIWMLYTFLDGWLDELWKSWSRLIHRHPKEKIKGLPQDAHVYHQHLPVHFWHLVASFHFLALHS